MTPQLLDDEMDRSAGRRRGSTKRRTLLDRLDDPITPRALHTPTTSSVTPSRRRPRETPPPPPLQSMSSLGSSNHSASSTSLDGSVHMLAPSTKDSNPGEVRSRRRNTTHGVSGSAGTTSSKGISNKMMTAGHASMSQLEKIKLRKQKHALNKSQRLSLHDSMRSSTNTPRRSRGSMTDLNQSRRGGLTTTSPERRPLDNRLTKQASRRSLMAPSLASSQSSGCGSSIDSASVGGRSGGNLDNFLLDSPEHEKPTRSSLLRGQGSSRRSLLSESNRQRSQRSLQRAGSRRSLLQQQSTLDEPSPARESRRTPGGGGVRRSIKGISESEPGYSARRSSATGASTTGEDHRHHHHNRSSISKSERRQGTSTSTRRRRSRSRSRSRSHSGERKQSTTATTRRRRSKSTGRRRRRSKSGDTRARRNSVGAGSRDSGERRRNSVVSRVSSSQEGAKARRKSQRDRSRSNSTESSGGRRQRDRSKSISRRIKPSFPKNLPRSSLKNNSSVPSALSMSSSRSDMDELNVTRRSSTPSASRRGSSSASSDAPFDWEKEKLRKSVNGKDRKRDSSLGRNSGSSRDRKMDASLGRSSGRNNHDSAKKGLRHSIAGSGTVRSREQAHMMLHASMSQIPPTTPTTVSKRLNDSPTHKSLHASLNHLETKNVFATDSPPTVATDDAVFTWNKKPDISQSVIDIILQKSPEHQKKASAAVVTKKSTPRETGPSPKLRSSTIFDDPPSSQSSPVPFFITSSLESSESDGVTLSDDDKDEGGDKNTKFGLDDNLKFSSGSIVNDVSIDTSDGTADDAATEAVLPDDDDFSFASFDSNGFGYIKPSSSKQSKASTKKSPPGSPTTKNYTNLSTSISSMFGEETASAVMSSIKRHKKGVVAGEDDADSFWKLEKDEDLSFLVEDVDAANMLSQIPQAYMDLLDADGGLLDGLQNDSMSSVSDFTRSTINTASTTKDSQSSGGLSIPSKESAIIPARKTRAKTDASKPATKKDQHSSPPSRRVTLKLHKITVHEDEPLSPSSKSPSPKKSSLKLRLDPASKTSLQQALKKDKTKTSSSKDHGSSSSKLKDSSSKRRSSRRDSTSTSGEPLKDTSTSQRRSRKLEEHMMKDNSSSGNGQSPSSRRSRMALDGTQVDSPSSNGTSSRRSRTLKDLDDLQNDSSLKDTSSKSTTGSSVRRSSRRSEAESTVEKAPRKSRTTEKSSSKSVKESSSSKVRRSSTKTADAGVTTTTSSASKRPSSKTTKDGKARRRTSKFPINESRVRFPVNESKVSTRAA